MKFASAFWRAALLATATSLTPASWGQASLSEADVKAALVFNFARYIEWPERAFSGRDSPLVICLIGRDRLVGALNALEGRKLQNRVVKVRNGIALDDSRGCHVVFLADVPDRQLASMLRTFAGQPVLTVGDTENFIDGGGAIGIVQGDQRLQFEVNRSALDHAQLKASSQLLKLARAVIGQGG